VTVRLGILECDHVDAPYRRVAGDYRDMFDALLVPHDATLQTVPYDVCNGVLPSTPTGCDAWLITGSRHSVYEDLGWIASLSEFVRRVRDASVPCVGICFGHQLIAQALGGKTERAATGWGAGAHRIELASSYRWMNPAAASCDLLFMHQDQVVSLPPGGELFGSTDHCPIAALTVGSSIVGIQAHPEFPADYVDTLLSARLERIGAAKTERARASLSAPVDANLVGGWLVQFMKAAAA
jgi:GMP synthase-like glutamine amidotransferase